jgi:hypothetical protein
VDPAAIAGIGVVGTLAGVGVNELFASKRATKAIGAQERQLANQLAHDRGSRDLVELREVLDAAAAAAMRISDTCITWVNRLATLDQSDSADMDEAIRLQRTVYEEIFGLSQHRLRIDLRLMFDSEVSEAFGNLRDSWAETFKTVGASRRLSREEYEQAFEHINDSAGKYGLFLSAAHALVQSRPDAGAGAWAGSPGEDH